jgi:RNA polymerase sigma-70 factor (ECF subfamily)
MVERARSDRAAFADIYHEFFTQIYKYTLYRVRDRGTAEDLTAQVFERAMRDFKRYDPRKARLGAWIFGMSRHLISDHFRRQKRHAWLPLRDQDDPVSEKIGPEEVAIQNDDHEQLLTAMEHLTERQRDILALKFSGHLTNRRIAELTNLNESHVAVIVYRALQRLRKELQEGEDDD